jgi:hypothetical protein
MESPTDRRQKWVSALRWTARVWSVASVALVLAFIVGEGFALVQRGRERATVGLNRIGVDFLESEYHIGPKLTSVECGVSRARHGSTHALPPLPRVAIRSAFCRDVYLSTFTSD